MNNRVIVLSKWITDHPKLVLVLAVLIIAIITIPPIVKDSIDKKNTKAVISKVVGQTEFDVTQIVAEYEDWLYVKIESNGNPAYVVLRREDGNMTLKQGPGTSFTRHNLQAVGVPQEMQKVILNQ